MTPVRFGALLLLILGTLLAACGDDGPREPTRVSPTEMSAATATLTGAPRGPFRILALGDSYTIGERVPRAESWPLQLREELRSRGFDVREPLVIAQTGWTTRDLLSATDSVDLPSGPYDLVTLQIGVNNEFRGWFVDDFRPDLVALLARALSFAGDERDRVMVLSIPDYGVTPAAIGFSREVIAASIDRFNVVVAEEAARFGFAYFDVTGISREAAEDLTLLAPDELHPSGLMYARWVALLEPAVFARFESMGAVSASWTEAEMAQYDEEVRLRRHP